MNIRKYTTAGIISLFLLYDLAKQCISPKAIAIALAFFACLEPLVYYSSEVKQYSSDVAIALLVYCVIFRYINIPTLTLIQAWSWPIAYTDYRDWLLWSPPNPNSLPQI